MKNLVIGLGNPGKQYAHNRHNVGHMFVDFLSNYELQIKNYELKLLKTDSFMNDSGSFVAKQIRNSSFVISNLILVHDDLDIPLGKFKIQFGVGPKVHNGVESVEQHLGTTDFWRIRIGVDNRDPENRVPGDQYVLQDFTTDELIPLKKGFEEIEKDLKTRLDSGSSPE